MTGWTLDDVRSMDPDEYEVLTDLMNKAAKKHQP